jgi:hypothetical protein
MFNRLLLRLVGLFLLVRPYEAPSMGLQSVEPQYSHTASFSHPRVWTILIYFRAQPGPSVGTSTNWWNSLARRSKTCCWKLLSYGSLCSDIRAPFKTEGSVPTGKVNVSILLIMGGKGNSTWTNNKWSPFMFQQ